MSLAVGRPLAATRIVAKCPQRSIHRQAVFPSAADLTITGRPQLRVRQASRADDSGIVATVFGCTGFMGRYVVALLGRIGSQVICPYRGDGMNARHLKLSGELGQIVPVPFRPKDEESIYRAVERSNVVINLIGQDRPTRNFSLDDAHVALPSKIAQISKQAGAQRFLSISALGATPDSVSTWLASKGKGEIAIREAFPDATIFRPCSTFGRNDRFLNRFARLAFSFPLIPLVDGGSQKLQPVAVENVAQAVVSSLSFQDAIGATYELGGPDVFTFEELTELVYKHTGLESNTVPLPLAVARLYGSMISALPANLSPLTADQVVRTTIDSTVSTRPVKDGVKTFADLNIVPTSLHDVANQVLSIYKKDYDVPADIKY